MRTIDAYGRFATLVVVKERIDPFPDDFLTAVNFKQSSAGPLANQNVARVQRAGTRDMSTIELVRRFAGILPDNLIIGYVDFDHARSIITVIEN